MITEIEIEMALDSVSDFIFVGGTTEGKESGTLK